MMGKRKHYVGKMNNSFLKPKKSKRRRIGPSPILSTSSPWETLPKEIWDTIFDSFNDETYYEVLFTGQPRKLQLEFLRVASKTLHKRCEEYLARVKDPESYNHNPADVMASRGYLSCVKYLEENNMAMSTRGLAGAICDGPHWDVIKYAVEKLDVPWSHEAMVEIAERDDVELVKYAKRTGGAKFFDDLSEYAAELGSLNCLKELKKMRFKWDDPELITRAVSSGNLECVKLLYSSIREWDSGTCGAAANTGNLELLKFCHENGAPWDEYVVINSADGEFLDCLKYAVENGAPVSPEALDYALSNLACLKYLHEHLKQWPEAVQWLHAFYMPDGNTHIDPVDAMKYAHENGAPWSADVLDYAAEAGAINCLRYAHENGAEWTQKTCFTACWGKSLECLKYCHENGAPWDEETSWAASCHSLDCLKYCHENGCPWDSATLWVAASPEHFDCLKYAFENGCPWDKEVCRRCYYQSISQYIHEQGFPCDCKKI